MSEDNWEQCEITGKMFPHDELVTFQGKRVSAEGKAILLERLKSGETVQDEQRPTVGRRFGCIFIDSLFFTIPSYLINQNATPQNVMTMALALVALQTVQLIYLGQMHGMRGQTLGKIAGSLRVVNLDGSPVTLAKAYIRAAVYVFPSIVILASIFTRNAQAIETATIFSWVWILLTILLALVDRKMQRPIHDRVAGTRVIQE